MHGVKKNYRFLKCCNYNQNSKYEQFVFMIKKWIFMNSLLLEYDSVVARLQTYAYKTKEISMDVILTSNIAIYVVWADNYPEEHSQMLNCATPGSWHLMLYFVTSSGYMLYDITTYILIQKWNILNIFTAQQTILSEFQYDSHIVYWFVSEKCYK